MLAFAAAGATVCAAARRPERLDAVVSAAPKGSKVHRVVLDLASEDSCKAAVKDAVGWTCYCLLDVAVDTCV